MGYKGSEGGQVNAYGIEFMMFLGVVLIALDLPIQFIYNSKKYYWILIIELFFIFFLVWWVWKGIGIY